jgi:hypothetical protein
MYENREKAREIGTTVRIFLRKQNGTQSFSKDFSVVADTDSEDHGVLELARSELSSWLHHFQPP